MKSLLGRYGVIFLVVFIASFFAGSQGRMSIPPTSLSFMAKSAVAKITARDLTNVPEKNSLFHHRFHRGLGESKRTLLNYCKVNMGAILVPDVQRLLCTSNHVLLEGTYKPPVTTPVCYFGSLRSPPLC